MSEDTDPLGVRYRYKSEIRPSNLHGATSTDAHKTFPAIELYGSDASSVQDFLVVVSCVTDTLPRRPHPHKISAEAACEYGVLKKTFTNTLKATFPNLGVQCVKKKEIAESLALRRSRNINPFKSENANKCGNLDG